MGSLWGGFAPWKVLKTALMDIARENEGHVRNQRSKISPKSSLLWTTRSLFSIDFDCTQCLQGSRQKGTKNTWRKCRPNELKIWGRGFFGGGEFNAANRSSWNLFVLVQTGFEFTENWNFKYLKKKLIFQELNSSKSVWNGFLGGFSGSGNSLRWQVACYSLMRSPWGGFAPWKVPKTALMDISRENEGHIRNQRSKISPKSSLLWTSRSLSSNVVESTIAY